MSPGPSHRRPHVPVIVACCVGGFAMGVNFTNVGALASRVAHGYGISLATVGLLTATLITMHAFMQLPGGPLADRVGARTMSVVGLSIVLVSNIGLAFVPDVGPALVLRALTGVGTGVSFVA